MNFLITPAHAQGLSGLTGAFGNLGGLAQFAPLVLIFVVFYFLLIRPQQTRQKQTRAMLMQLKRGDRVVTAGGIVGGITRVPAAVDGKPSTEVEVEIASGVRVMVLRDTIGSVLAATPANDAKAKGSVP